MKGLGMRWLSVTILSSFFNISMIVLKLFFPSTFHLQPMLDLPPTPSLPPCPLFLTGEQTKRRHIITNLVHRLHLISTSWSSTWSTLSTTWQSSSCWTFCSQLDNPQREQLCVKSATTCLRLPKTSRRDTTTNSQPGQGRHFAHFYLVYNKLYFLTKL